jgi:hypothetical protein
MGNNWKHLLKINSKLIYLKCRKQGRNFFLDTGKTEEMWAIDMHRTESLNQKEFTQSDFLIAAQGIS